MKYELTNETIEYRSEFAPGTRILHRIKALKDFNGVEAGTLGGWIESEDNLSQLGNCWVADSAKVYEGARVYDNAQIRHHAEVANRAQVSGHATVYNHAKVLEDAEIFGDATIAGYSKISGLAQISGDALVDDSDVYGIVHIDQSAIVDHSTVYDFAQISGGARIYEAEIFGDADIYGEAHVFNNAKVYGDAVVRGYDRIARYADISESHHVFTAGSLQSNQSGFDAFTAYRGKDPETGETIIMISAPLFNVDAKRAIDIVAGEDADNLDKDDFINLVKIAVRKIQRGYEIL